MREKKDSGVPWIGEIPKEWGTTRIKYVLKESKERSIDGNEMPLSLSRGSGLIPSSMKENKTLESASYINAKVIHPGEIVFNRFKARLFAVSNYHGLVSPDYAVYQDSGKHVMQYYVYLFSTEPYRAAFDNKASGIGDGFSRLYTDDLFSMPTLLPPYNDQSRIVAFLDAKCAEIDTVLESTRASIEEYKKLKQSVITEAVTTGVHGKRPMKDSGVEWIGEIPEEWAVCRGKTIMTLLERPVKEDDGVITCFRDGEVTLRSKRREEGFTFSLQEAGYQGIEPGDLVVHGMDGFAGAIGISDSRGKATPVLNVLDSQENKRFLMYQIRAMAYCGLFLSLATGIRVRSCDTNWNKLKVIRYFIPSRKEQDEIVSFLDHSLPAIDGLIASKEALITELESYKKSLIYEYVTGKKEVPAV
jgi:type I restriction enzyme S subunit